MAIQCHTGTGLPAASFTLAYNDTDTALDDLRGLTVVLSDLARETDAIDHVSHDTSPLMAMIRVIERKAYEVVRLHEAQHDAWRAEQDAARATPVAACFHQWRKAFDTEKRAFAEADPREDPCHQCDQATASLNVAAKQIMAVPARNERDWLLKFWAASEGGDLAMHAAEDAGLWAEAKALIGGVA